LFVCLFVRYLSTLIDSNVTLSGSSDSSVTLVLASVPTSISAGTGVSWLPWRGPFALTPMTLLVSSVTQVPALRQSR
jgi:hypothetical protein